MVDDRCIEWPGARTTAGYGRVGDVYMHRFIWELLNGPVPKGMSVCHRCDNPPCVKPTHLFLGTHTDNMRDMFSKNRRRTVAPRGQHHGTSKLTDADVVDIRRRAVVGIRGKSGRTAGVNGNVAELAREFGVSSSLIWMIARRKIWRHL